jgi:hypothetical protein
MSDDLDKYEEKLRGWQLSPQAGGCIYFLFMFVVLAILLFAAVGLGLALYRWVTVPDRSELVVPTAARASPSYSAFPMRAPEPGTP